MGTDKRIRSLLTVAILAAAVALPSAAQARPNTNPVASSEVVAIEPQVAASGNSGFQWDDAAIGAGAAALLVGATVAAGGSTRRRRVRGSAIG
jgi:hypothetical protein